MSDTPSKIALVTGGNGGIGLETARGLLQAGFHVVVHGRSAEKTRHAAEQLQADTGRPTASLVADLADFEQVRRMADEFRRQHDRLDVLVNNAGLFNRTYTQTPDGIEHTLAVNHLGHFVLTHELLDLMTPGTGRIVNVSSRAHTRAPEVDFENLNLKGRYGLWNAYGQSKLFNIWFTRELARRLDGTGIATNALHPGVIATDIVRHLPFVARWLWALFTKTPADGAKTSLAVALSAEGGRTTGGYWRDEAPATPSPQAQDDAAAERLWHHSEQLTGATAWAQKIEQLRART